MIEQEYVDRVFDDLTKMDVELDPNPLEFGPSALNEKTALVRAYLSNTEKIFMEISHNLHKYKRDLLKEESAFNIAMNRLMAEDPHVRSGRSQQEREALATMRLTENTSRIDNIKLSVNDLEELMKIVKAKRADLKDIQGRLKDQLKLCQEELALGQRWGVKSSGDSNTVIHTRPIDDADDELDKVFSDVLNQAARGPLNTKPIPESNADISDVDDFLNADISTEATVKVDEEEIDFTDIFNND